ncbi:MAG: hypothetical protein BWY49_00871 [Candidatus Omnitrophica bacterium ADurb.Bin314]|nr:MAG: hypothetical protein BWY49_00871 [Candidatus Omnitrophica bacterium ADurb.Bin314]
MRKAVIAACFMITLTVSARVWSAPQLRLAAPPRNASTAQTFLYEVRMEWPVAEGAYEVSPTAPVFENLDLIAQSQSQETTGTVSRLILQFTLRGIQKGPARIGTLDIRYRLAPSTEWRVLPVPDQTVQIAAAFPWKGVIGSVALAILLPLGSFFGIKGFKAYRERERIKNLPPPDPKQRVYAKAEETILTYKGETQRDTIDHWTEAVKGTAITYYDLALKSATGRDILEALKGKSLTAKESSEITALFRRIEELRYAGNALPVREMELLQKTFLQYVRGKIIIENPPR